MFYVSQTEHFNFIAIINQKTVYIFSVCPQAFPQLMGVILTGKSMAIIKATFKINVRIKKQYQFANIMTVKLICKLVIHIISYLILIHFCLDCDESYHYI